MPRSAFSLMLRSDMSHIVARQASGIDIKDLTTGMPYAIHGCMKAKNTMSKDLIIIDPAASLREAYSLMKLNGIRHLPVVASDGEIVGILSDRDIARAMQSQLMKDPNGQITETDDIDPKLRVTDYMNWPVVTVERNSDVRDVALTMVTKKISAVLVRTNDRIEGIITSEDLLKLLVKVLSNDYSKDFIDRRHTIDDFLRTASA